MSEEPTATVLVVDDEKSVADTYAHRLGLRFETEAVYNGEDALTVLAETDVDIVLLDRRMPDLTGDEVLQHVRDEGYDCRVLMLTAVDPGFETLDMPFDDYLCKPVEQDALLHAVEQQLRVLALEQLGEYLQLLAKREVVAASTDQTARKRNDRYQSIVDRCERLETELSAHLDVFDDLDAAFKEVDRDP